MLAALRPGPRAVALTLLTSGVLLATFGVLKAQARIELRAVEQRACAAELKALVARNPFVQTFSRHADACLALTLVTR